MLLSTAVCKSNRQMYVGQIYSVLSSRRPSLLTHFFTESSRRLLAFNYTHLLKVIPHGIQTPKTPKHKQSALSLWATCYGNLGVLSVYAYFRVFIRKRRTKRFLLVLLLLLLSLLFLMSLMSPTSVCDAVLLFCIYEYVHPKCWYCALLRALRQWKGYCEVVAVVEGWKRRWCWSFLLEHLLYYSYIIYDIYCRT